MLAELILTFTHLAKVEPHFSVSGPIFLYWLINIVEHNQEIALHC